VRLKNKMSDLKDVRFHKDPLETRIFKIKLDENPTLKRIIRKRLIINGEVDQEIYRRRTGVLDNFTPIMIRGQQGSFKSSADLCFSRKTDPSFCAEQVAFMYEEFINLISDSGNGQTLQLDEEVFQHGTGSIRIVEELKNLVETLRKARNSMTLISPSNKYFDEDVFCFTLETLDHCLLGTCKKNKNLHEIRTCKIPDTEHKMSKAYVRLAVRKSQRYMGLYIQEIRWADKLWKEYDKKKDAFIIKVKNLDFKKLDYEKEAEKIIEQTPDIEDYKTKHELRLLIDRLKPNLAVGESDLLIAQIKMTRKRT